MVDFVLAIPQLNDNGASGLTGIRRLKVQAIAWKAADEETRSRALRYLASTFEARLHSVAKSAIPVKQRFSYLDRYLRKRRNFPGENHVFLVNGKPVITF